MESLSSLFENVYVERMRAKEATFRSGSCPPPQRALDECSPLPKLLPQSVWERLSPEQRWATIVQKGWKERLRRDASERPTVQTLAQRAFPELRGSSEATEAFTAILRRGKLNEKNPTLSVLAQSVRAAVNRREPIQVVVSQCIEKAPEVRPAKLDFLAGRKTERVDLPRITAGLESACAGTPGKGWPEIRSLIADARYPLEVTLLLGDMDPLTIDGGTEWLTPGAIRRLGDEVRALQAATQSAANRYFGPDAVTVKRWSELYSLQDFSESVPRAMRTDRWPSERPLKDAFKLYEQYGYPRLAQTLGIPAEVMQRFITEDICRTAAQYRLEADILKARGVTIQGWAESVPQRTWPIHITNYDGSGYMPSVVLT